VDWILEDSSRGGFRLHWAGEADLLAGCAALSMHMRPAPLNRATPKRKRRGHKAGPPSQTPALVLPSDRAKGHTAGLLVPAHMCQERKIVQRDVRDHRLRVELTAIREHWGASTHFEVTSARRAVEGRCANAGNGRSVWEAV